MSIPADLPEELQQAFVTLWSRLQEEEEESPCLFVEVPSSGGVWKLSIKAVSSDREYEILIRKGMEL